MDSLASRQLWWRALFRWEPMRHAAWETFLFRLGIAWVAWQTIGGPSHWNTQTDSHGVAAWGVDFTWLGDAELAKWLVPLWGVCLVLYLLSGISLATPWRRFLDIWPCRSRVHPIVMLILRIIVLAAFGLCWAVDKIVQFFPPVISLLPPLIASWGHGTLGNSHRAIGHTTQLVTLVLLASWLAAVWAMICKLRRKPLPFDFTPPQLAADWTRQVFMSTYVVSAITKLIQSHGLWFKDAPYFSLQIVKAMGMAKYGDYGEGRDVEWFAQLMLDHPWLAKLFIGGALPLELFAFVALLNRRLALAFGIAMYLFHSSVTELMHLGFVYHKMLLLVLMVNPVWWLVHWAQLWFGGKRKTENGTPLASRL